MMTRTARMAVATAFFGVLVSGAGAAELRPLQQNDFCLDAGTELRPRVKKIALAGCNNSDAQNFRKGQKNTIVVGALCLQAFVEDRAVGRPRRPLHRRRWPALADDA